MFASQSSVRHNCVLLTHPRAQLIRLDIWAPMVQHIRRARRWIRAAIPAEYVYGFRHFRLLACGKHYTLPVGTREVPILIKRVGPWPHPSAAKDTPLASAHRAHLHATRRPPAAAVAAPLPRPPPSPRRLSPVAIGSEAERARKHATPRQGASAPPPRAYRLLRCSCLCRRAAASAAARRPRRFRVLAAALLAGRPPRVAPRRARRAFSA